MDKERASPLLLVSDLDDTIKISHTQSKLITVYRGLFRSSAFAGMAGLYHEILSRHPESGFAIVSSSPPAIRGKIESFLRLNRFPPGLIVLRDWLRQPSVLKYKLKAVLEVTEQSPFPVILVGDDTEHDPEVLAHAAKKFPDRVLARYIRVVKGRELPEGSQGFFTAFDIACSELAAGRLSSEQVLRVGEAVLQAEKNSRLIPRFSLKPPLHFAPFLTKPDEAIMELWKKIQAKLESIPRRKTKP
jgi:phosphatidate phosphatase APP1